MDCESGIMALIIEESGVRVAREGKEWWLCDFPGVD
jgi:hypothetical protein